MTEHFYQQRFDNSEILNIKNKKEIPKFFDFFSLHFSLSNDKSMKPMQENYGKLLIARTSDY